MNRYGRMAYDHASQHRPKAFASIADPIHHFSQLGQEVETRITTLRDELLGSLRPSENLEDYRKRSYQARHQAEEIVLAEMVWTEPEPTTQPEDDEVLAYRSQLAMVSRALASADRDWTLVPAELPNRP
jgi:hypothetical protein